jgi:hypothetical protein
LDVATAATEYPPFVFAVNGEAYPNAGLAGQDFAIDFQRLRAF